MKKGNIQSIIGIKLRPTEILAGPFAAGLLFMLCSINGSATNDSAKIKYG
jgi:hypothetical protein